MQSVRVCACVGVCFLLCWWSALYNVCVFVCVCVRWYVVHVDNVLLFFLCGYLVKGKIPVRWSSRNMDYREGIL